MLKVKSQNLNTKNVCTFQLNESLIYILIRSFLFRANKVQMLPYTAIYIL